MTSEERELCGRALAAVVGRYGWRGQWDDEEFLQEILTEFQTRLPRVRGRSIDQIGEDAATFCYCRRWYRACGQNGAAAQHIALEALHRWIYRSVYYQVNGDEQMAQEIAQQALVSVWRGLERMREPGAFLGYVRQTVRRQIPRTVGLSEGWEELTEMIEERRGEDAMDEGVEEEERREVEELIRFCLRSRERQELLIEHILNGRGIGEIAQNWGKKPGTIHTLKSRAIDQLRQCEELLQWRAQRSKGDASDQHAPSRSVAYLCALLDEATSGMSCDECRSWLPVYVEAEVSGFDVNQQYLEVRRHIDLCVECEREYVELLDSTLGEMSADWSDIPVPPPNLSFLPSLAPTEYVRWLLEGVMGELQPAQLPRLQLQMVPLLRQFNALLSHPVPTPVGVMGADRGFQRLNLATYDVARSLLQSAPAALSGSPAILEGWVRREAERAAQHQGLVSEEAEAFVATVTQLVCHNPSLLRQVAP